MLYLPAMGEVYRGILLPDYEERDTILSIEDAFRATKEGFRRALPGRIEGITLEGVVAKMSDSMRSDTQNDPERRERGVSFYVNLSDDSLHTLEDPTTGRKKIVQLLPASPLERSGYSYMMPAHTHSEDSPPTPRDLASLFYSSSEVG